MAEAIALLMDKGLHAVPVVDETGKPLGVLSHSDIVAHDRKQFKHLTYSELAEGLNGITPTAPTRASADGADAGIALRRVREIMTPVIYAVRPEACARAVVQHMLVLGVHRLFVTGSDGRLLGVISSLDVLRHLHELLLFAFENVELLRANDKEFASAASELHTTF